MVVEYVPIGWNRVKVSKNLGVTGRSMVTSLHLTSVHCKESTLSPPIQNAIIQIIKPKIYKNVTGLVLSWAEAYLKLRHEF